MARMPDALWHGEHGSIAMTEQSLNKVCVHTIVGNPPANAAHFSVRADGLIYQSRDTRFRSAANAYGNDDVIAIENDDHGPEYGAWNVNDGHAVPGFTAAQIESNARIIAWAYRTHAIPIVPCPDSRDASEGVAYHRQGVDGNFAAEGYAYGGRVAGGEVWSEARGKVCPGDRRITQLLQLIIPRARQLAGLEGDSMDMNDPDANALANRVWSALVKGETTRTVGTGAPEDNVFVTDVKSAAGRIQAIMRNQEKVTWGPATGEDNIIHDELASIRDELTALSAKVDAIELGGVDVAQLAALLTPALADELDRRARDADPGTGPTT